ncbi:Tripartite motif-containing protein 3 [Geodia barretti]|uniref:Tripartite motif-containing protein 3 n=1 Tax=Geodia barretti TaxID=519541 RepID=A0AA35WSR7_GEOBA|nr:Tripartite motif-containing protein 3 [Geodia barretti]
MTTRPSTGAEKALQKIKDQVTCVICLEPYKKPKLLKCLHASCEACLQRLVHWGPEGQSVTCPQCRQDTALPLGVQGLQGAFYVNAMLDIQETLKNTTVSDRCPNHPTKEADLYCNQCDQLMCNHCLVPGHRYHKYDLLAKSFAKLQKVLAHYSKPMEEQIAALEKAVESVGTRCSAVVEQKTAVVAEIRAAMARMRQALEEREMQLVGRADQVADQKLRALTAQRTMFELQLGQLRSSQEFVDVCQRTCSQGEMMSMKDQLVKQMTDLTGSFKPESLVPAEQANMGFAHSLPEPIKSCQRFGIGLLQSSIPEKCQVSGEGIKLAMRGQTVAVTVKALNKGGKPLLCA